MELTKIESSNIEAVGYEPNKLHVKYKTGREYVYDGVPDDIYQKLMVSESKGRFVNSEIKNKYLFEELK